MSLFDLTALRVFSLAAAAKAPDAGTAAASGGAAAAIAAASGGATPALFDSLDIWFRAQLGLLASRVPYGALETTLRVFLAPQQSVVDLEARQAGLHAAQGLLVARRVAPLVADAGFRAGAGRVLSGLRALSPTFNIVDASSPPE